MSFTEVVFNNGLSITKESNKQKVVTNNLGRDVEHGELVYLGGYFGVVVEYGGIANAATGKIQLLDGYVIRTEQMEATDTFVAGAVVHFVPGGSGAAGKIVDTPEADSIPVGVCVSEEGTGGAQTAIEFEVFNPDVVKVKKVDIPTGSHAAGSPVVITDIPAGSEILRITARSKATVGSETLTVTDGTNTVSVLDIDTVNVVLDGTLVEAYRKVIAAGLTFTALTTAGTAEAVVYYR